MRPTPLPNRYKRNKDNRVLLCLRLIFIAYVVSVLKVSGRTDSKVEASGIKLDGDLIKTENAENMLEREGL